MWDWIFMIYSLSFIFLVFGFLWKWIIILPAASLLVTLNIKSDISLQLLNFIGYYFLASYTAFYVIGVGVIQSANTISIFLATLGFLFILFQGIINIGQQENGIRGLFSLLFGLIMYIIILFSPQIGDNPLNKWLIKIISWIYDLPIIGWVIGLFAFFYALYITFVGLFIILSFLGQLTSVLRKDSSI